MSTALLPDPTQLRLLCLTATDTRITIDVRPQASEGRCPLCAHHSMRIHSHYVRTLADLPWSSVAVQVRLHARRFFCPNSACKRRIFTERLPGIVEPYARRTNRLTSWVTHVAFLLGGEPGSRLLRRGCAPISGDTLLGCIRSFRLPDASVPTILSVDDFALRRGRIYGTILVDLQRHRVIDLLPDRSADGFAQWLVDHGGVDVISRDRGGEYAQGARQGAPEAVQVADRFHLLRNAGDVTRRVLQRHASVVQRLPAPGPPQLELSRRRLDREVSKHRTRDTMRTRFEQIHALAAEGLSKEAIARRLDLNRQTIYKYLALTAPPERRPAGRQGSAIVPYEGYILRRWEKGCRNGKQLWREVRSRAMAARIRMSPGSWPTSGANDGAAAPGHLLPPGSPRDRRRDCSSSDQRTAKRISSALSSNCESSTRRYRGQWRCWRDLRMSCGRVPTRIPMNAWSHGWRRQSPPVSRSSWRL